MTDVVLQEKFRSLRDAASSELVERVAVVDTMVLSLIARLHHFQIGSPGIAKSLAIRAIEKRIDDMQPQDHFEILMTRFTSPEEFFGPWDLAGLRENRFRRNTDGMAPQAKFWFIDEVFKANASILNSLLWALNERLFRNDGDVADLPLWSMFCASNEMPEGEELNALYDRIQFRLHVKPIQELGNFIQMLKQQNVGEPEKILTFEDIERAHEESSTVEIPNDVLDAIAQIRNDLRNEGIEPTDRRFAQTLSVIRAQAWLDGSDMVDLEHLRPLTHVLWTTPDEAPKVERLLLELANPLDKEAMALLETVDQLGSELDKILSDKQMDATLRSKKGIELHNKVERATQELQKLKKQVENSNRKSAKIEEVRQRLLSVTGRLLKEIFKIEMDADPNIGGI